MKIITRKEAKEKGLKRYFTGKACKNGHIAERLVCNKTCIDCERIRKAKKTGKAVVPLNDETCSGCHMSVTAQVVNEVLAGDKVHSCSHCGRLLFAPENFVEEDSGTA